MYHSENGENKDIKQKRKSSEIGARQTKTGVFWLNIAKFEVNWCYRYCFNLFSNLRKESELQQ